MNHEEINAYNEIREYISPVSKRAAVISSIFSAIIFLKSIEAIPEDSSRIPIINLPLTDEAEAILFPVLALIFFCMWLYRYNVERRYTGRVIQYLTNAVKKNLKQERELQRSTAANLVIRENQLQGVIDNPAMTSTNSWAFHEGGHEGQRIFLIEGAKPHSNEMQYWPQIANYRKSLTDHANNIKLLQKVSEELETKELNLYRHTMLSYVITPIFLAIAAFASFIVHYWPSLCHVVSFCAENPS